MVQPAARDLLDSVAGIVLGKECEAGGDVARRLPMLQHLWQTSQSCQQGNGIFGFGYLGTVHGRQEREYCGQSYARAPRTGELHLPARSDISWSHER